MSMVVCCPVGGGLRPALLKPKTGPPGPGGRGLGSCRFAFRCIDREVRPGLKSRRLSVPQDHSDGGRCASAARTIYGGTSPPDSPSWRTGSTSKMTKALNNPKDTTTNSSDLMPLTVPHGGAGKEALAHMWRDESQGILQPFILDLSVRVSGRVRSSRRHRMTRLKAPTTLPSSPRSSSPWKTRQP